MCYSKELIEKQNQQNGNNVDNIREGLVLGAAKMETRYDFSYRHQF